MESRFAWRPEPALALAICLVVLAGLFDVGLLARTLF